MGAILAEAQFPPALSDQILNDGVSMGLTLGSIFPTAREIEIKLEIFGENTCARWHQDNFAARALVSYTGPVGTEYTKDSNVDFWELTHCGKNSCVIRDPAEVKRVGVGDFLLIKGTQFAFVHGGASGLVHKSPEKVYHDDGRILNRLVLKLDVGTFGSAAEAAVRATAQARAAAALSAREACDLPQSVGNKRPLQ
eukprot:1286105-Prymnesium_polylepis.1